MPNASVMVIEHAERFGLSQLHQLRGRVGRDRAPVVLLVCCIRRRCRTRRASRLKALTETTDGFEIAERDLGAARAGRFLRHAPGRRADVPVDRSGPRPRAARSTRTAKPSPGSTTRRADADCRGDTPRRTGQSAVQADRDRVVGRVRIIAGTIEGTPARRRRRGTDCGRRPTGCARRSSTCSGLASTARACSTALRGRVRSASRRCSRGAAAGDLRRAGPARGRAHCGEPGALRRFERLYCSPRVPCQGHRHAQGRFGIRAVSTSSCSILRTIGAAAA